MPNSSLAHDTSLSPDRLSSSSPLAGTVTVVLRSTPLVTHVTATEAAAVVGLISRSWSPTSVLALIAVADLTKKLAISLWA